MCVPEPAITNVRNNDRDESATAIAFLARDSASYITGQMVIIDGGNAVQEYKGPPTHYY
jgi:3-oxoacyl-[acyl-carrier protein] reductase